MTVLTGSATTCPVGSFYNDYSIAGGCTETYILDGAFTGNDSWAGELRLEFVGPDCSCFGLDPCIDQTFVIDAWR